MTNPGNRFLICSTLGHLTAATYSAVIAFTAIPKFCSAISHNATETGPLGSWKRTIVEFHWNGWNAAED